MKRLIYLCMLLMCSISMSAQSADQLYDEGKKLYDAEQYDKAVKESNTAAYCHPADLTYAQSTSCEILGWVKHNWNQDFQEKYQ